MTLIFWLSFAFLWGLVVVQGLALLEMVRQVVDLRRGADVAKGPRLLPDTVAIGASLPSAQSLRWAETGERVDWSTTLGEEATAIVLLHHGCASCYTVAGDLSRVAEAQAPGIRIIPVITAYSLDRAHEFIRTTKLPIQSALIEIPSPDDGGEVFARALNVNRKPAAVALRGPRIAAAATVLNGEQVATLLREVLQQEQQEDSGLIKHQVVQLARSAPLEAE